MDFSYHFQIQKEKLNNISNDIISQFVNEDGQIISDCEFFKVFRDHLPLTSEEFWLTAVHSIKKLENDEHIKMDHETIQYILILISFYTDSKFNAENFDNSSLLACQFYFIFLNVIGCNSFKKSIYRNVLNCLSTQCDRYIRNNNFHDALISMRLVLSKEILPKEHLQETLYELCRIIENKSYKVYSEFPGDNSVDAIHEALYCIRTLATRNWTSKFQFMVNYALLQGVISDHQSEYAKKNFRSLITNIKSNLRKDNFSNFQNVFLYIIMKSKTFDPMEANKVMLILGEQFFKETVFKLTTMGLSKEVKCKSNILRLFSVLLENLPTNIYEQSKLEVFIQTVFNIMMMNCINNDEAISLVSKICLLSKTIINKQFKVLLNCPTEYIYVENCLPTFCMKFSLHWTNRPRNRNILLIILRIMCLTYHENTDKDYAGILAMLTNEADPSDIKMGIPILINLYTTTRSKESKYVSEKVIEILHTMAVHNSSSSSDFVKILFQLAVEPSEELMPHKTEFIKSITLHAISDNKAFITKAYELRILETNNLKKLIREVSKNNYDYLKLTCAVFEKSPSPLGEQIVQHILAKSSLLSEAEYTGDLLFIINCSLRYFVAHLRGTNLSPCQQADLKEFKTLLWERIKTFSLPHNSLGVAFDVLKSISELFRETLDFQEFFQSVNSEVRTSLSKVSDECNVIPIMYSVELITNKKYSIPDDIINTLKVSLEKISQQYQHEDNASNTKLQVVHYCYLSLMVRVAMTHSKLGTKTMDHLKSALNSKDLGFKMKVMDLMYDLCTYVVHNFEDFLQYSFQDLKSLNPTVRKQAAVHIEHFIRLDYLKLSIQQYCKFISLLGDPTIERSLQDLLVNFVLTNQPVVEKYFLPLVMHINFYSVHPVCPMSPLYMQDMNCIIRANFNKWKLFTTLFRSLPQRSRFLILKEICSTFFDKFIQGELKIEDGIWNVLTDAISLFKIMPYDSLDNVKYEDYYEKGMGEIKRYLIEKRTLSSDMKSKYPGMKDIIEKVTHQLLHLLFYTDNEDILKNYKLKLFETIMFWTHDALPEIAGIVNLRNDNISKQISNNYVKLKEFYKKHKQCLNVDEYVSEYNETNR